MYRLLSGSSKFAVHALRDACVQQAKQTYEFGAAKFCFLLGLREAKWRFLWGEPKKWAIISVHFFVKRQRNEPKKAFVRGCRPLHIPAAASPLFAAEAGAKSIVIRRRIGVRGVAAVWIGANGTA